MFSNHYSNYKIKDYASLDSQYDAELDRQRTDDWFDDEEIEEEESANPNQASGTDNGNNEDEDDYMKMDLTKL